MIYIILIWNIITFALFGIDKYKAKKDLWRISEKTLILCSLLLGGIGGFMGMYKFRHKTKHALFTFLIPLSAVITFGALLYLIK